MVTSGEGEIRETAKEGYFSKQALKNWLQTTFTYTFNKNKN